MKTLGSHGRFWSWGVSIIFGRSFLAASFKDSFKKRNWRLRDQPGACSTRTGRRS